MAYNLNRQALSFVQLVTSDVSLAYAVVTIPALLPIVAIGVVSGVATTMLSGMLIGKGYTGAIVFSSSVVLYPLAQGWMAYSNPSNEDVKLKMTASAATTMALVAGVPAMAIMSLTGTLRPGLRTLRLLK